MRVSRTLTFLLILVILLPACVERFYPGEEAIRTGTLVVNADLSDQAVLQSIFVSRSDKLYFSEYKPEADCLVSVEDQEGSAVTFRETEPGTYVGQPDTSFLKVGKQYKLNLITSDGSIYESEYMQLPASTPLDSLYYDLEFTPEADVGKGADALRFFIDTRVNPEFWKNM